jgi:hypothetical protein
MATSPFHRITYKTLHKTLIDEAGKLLFQSSDWVVPQSLFGDMPDYPDVFTMSIKNFSCNL